ncbi:allene oxide cyclase barrel-like domain-containing protein [Streptomyces sp. NPDC048434]|uniref:allene oxide cyclase barrel-like domain-containing protein n=1 Tax=Streptomyces sp. NPDC048434 TaxID=3365549 RepID=UPI00371C0A22
MRHFKHVALSAVTGLAALLFCAPSASAFTGTGGGPNPPREEVFQLVAKQTQGGLVDVDGSGGPSLGDEFVFSGNLFRGSIAVGTFSEICTLTRFEPTDEFDLQCASDLSLSQGQLTVQGRFTVTTAGPGNIDMAITGGTGRYRTAHGYLHAVNITQTETQLTVHLIL